MQIALSNVSKRYRYEWVFKKINFTFESGEAYAITGPNGSGKSTLMRVLSAYLSPTKGTIQHYLATRKIEGERVYQHITYAAPYVDVIEEMTLYEQLQFHQKFKPFLTDITIEEILSLLAFQKGKNKQISHFSSGMKQRLKLALALCSKSSLILLDEPTTNLDRQGVDWYLNLVEQYKRDRTIIVASNVEEDYQFCDRLLDIIQYK